MSAADDPAPILYGDNQSTQELTRSGIKSERTKHIDIKYHFVTDEVSSGKVRLQWIPTTQQLADVLTKALGIQQHRVLCDKLMASAQAREVISSQDSEQNATGAVYGFAPVTTRTAATIHGASSTRGQPCGAQAPFWQAGRTLVPR